MEPSKISELEKKIRTISTSQRETLTRDLFDQTPSSFDQGGSSELELQMPEVKDVFSPLNAYLACALTGLSPTDRDHIFLLSDRVNEICAEFGIDLYEPRKSTDPVHHADVSHVEVFRLDRKKVLTSDLLICLAHHPSFGAGQELDFAFTCLLPILVIAPKERPISRMIRGIPSNVTVIQYSEPEQLKEQLREALVELKPLMRDRQYSLAKTEADFIGVRIKSLRVEQGLSIDDLAQSAKVDPDWISLLESGHEKESNPSIMQLRIIATVLKVPLAKLIDPAPGERIELEIIDALPRILAARYGHLQPSDRRAVVKSILDSAMEAIDETSA